MLQTLIRYFIPMLRIMENVLNESDGLFLAGLKLFAGECFRHNRIIAGFWWDAGGRKEREFSVLACWFTVSVLGALASGKILQYES